MKRKIYEIANELNLPSKEVVEVAQKLNIDVKSHLSTVTEEEITKITNKLKGNKVSSNTVNSENKENNVVNKKAKNMKKEVEEPVIIRRNVIVSEEKTKKRDEVNKKSNNEFGKVQKKNHSQNDFNIVYRERSKKPMTAAELLNMVKNGNSQEENSKKEEVEVKKPLEKFELSYLKESREKREDNRRENPRPDFKRRENRDNREFKPRENRDSRPRFENNRENRDNREGRENRENSTNFERREFRGRNNKDQREFKPRENRDLKPFNRNERGDRPSRFDKDSNSSNNFKKNDNFKFGNNKKEEVAPKEEIFKEKTLAENRKLSRQKEKEKEKNLMQDKKKSRNRIEEDFSFDTLNKLKGQGNFSGLIESGDIFDVYQSRRASKADKLKKKRLLEEKARKKEAQAKLTNIIIEETITVKDLAQALKVTASDLLMKLMAQGVMTTLNNSIDFETAYILAGEYGVTATKKNVVSFEEKLFDDSEDNIDELEDRPPVVVVMGHVDHGKTSLLDAIRNTNKAEGEAGGITQHIGAYQVEANNKLITFLDTPGHEAFISMRARGAKSTDMAVLVVAANDGVMPQTVEAISHAKAAEIPIIVAINKMDLPGANVDRIKQEMIEHGLVSEEWGGDTIFVPISAKTGEGIDNLLDMIQLQSEMLELKVNKNKQAKGTVLEARLDKTRGPIVSMLVNRGTLNVGDTVIVGTSIGRIRTMMDHNGDNITEAYPSTPVEVTGITTVPEAGATFYEVDDEKTAKKLIEKREREAREKKIGQNTAVTLDTLFANMESGNIKTLNIVVKSDVAGTAEAVKKSLEKLSTSEVQVKVISANVGAISLTDINLARVANAIVIGFNVRPEAQAKVEAENAGIEIKLYSVIYSAIDDVKNAMIGMLDPEYKEVVTGTVEVRAIFKISKIGTIAGSYVTSGSITRNSNVRVIRDNVVLTDSKLVSLKREKDDAKEVKSGYECGIQIEGFNDIEVGDTFEVYKIEEIKRKSLKED